MFLAAHDVNKLVSQKFVTKCRLEKWICPSSRITSGDWCDCQLSGNRSL